MKYLFIILVSLGVNLVCAQNQLSGRVINENGEYLEGASVFVMNANNLATISDRQGYFVLDSIDQDIVKLKVTFVGYESYEEEIDLTETEFINAILPGSIYQLDKIQIIANRLDDRSVFSFHDSDREEIGLKNLGQDLPFLVEHTPAMVVTSDAGAGIGYTGMRIRGSDATRINVTVNGVPLNDSESHGVFWVNMPDFGSSVDNIQIQRGVGPSTNGSSAFGATVGLNTNQVAQNPYVRMEGSYGSFNTTKSNIALSTGLMNNAYIIEGRYSLIDSDGFIDRASSDLDSWYFSAAKIGESNSLRLNIFSGKEVTYQAWNGVPEAKVEGDDAALLEHYFNNSNGDYNTVEDSINLFDSDRNYNTYLYDNQVDNYRQTHYQLHYMSQPIDNFKFNATAHYTRGRGFFQEFKYQDDLADYCLADSIHQVSDVIRRRWLDNHFYGVILNGSFDLSPAVNLTLGGSFNTYDGDHFGEVLEAAPLDSFETFRYYESGAIKDDANSYLKLDYQISPKLNLYGDAQYRTISYGSDGTDSDKSAFVIDTSYSFVNPKFGLNYQMDENKSVYLSYARAHREPVRSDFLDAVGTSVPLAERLDNVELGLRYTNTGFSLNSNFYYMMYKNQLVLTGAVNDVGAPVRTNVDDSYRMGLELEGNYRFNYNWNWSANLSLSRNKIKAFTQEIAFISETVFEDSDISFSPSVVAGSILSYTFSEAFNASLLSKFVGKQYLDNTQSDAKSLDPYWFNDIVLTYTYRPEIIQEIQLKLLLNNITNNLYSSNGYTYTYGYFDSGANEDVIITENYLYPQAGFNFLLSASLTF